MTLLSAAEISAMRTTQATAMPDTVVIQRYTTASDGGGGLVETYAAVGTVTGRISALGAGMDESDIGSKLTDVDTWMVTVPYDTTVYARDRLSISSRTFEVQSVGDHEAWETARRVVAVEVGG